MLRGDAYFALLHKSDAHALSTSGSREEGWKGGMFQLIVDHQLARMYPFSDPAILVRTHLPLESIHHTSNKINCACLLRLLDHAVVGEKDQEECRVAVSQSLLERRHQITQSQHLVDCIHAICHTCLHEKVTAARPLPSFLVMTEIIACL